MIDFQRYIKERYADDAEKQTYMDAILAMSPKEIRGNKAEMDAFLQSQAMDAEMTSMLLPLLIEKFKESTG